MRQLGRYDAGVLLGSGIYLIFNLFSFRGTPYLLGGDEMVFWTNAQRMLHGEFIYRDFFEFTPPGTDLVYLSAFELLGSRIWVPNVVALVLGIILCWVCFHISRQLMKPSAAALAAAAFMVLNFGKWLDSTHHWFSLLAVMTAVTVLMQARTPARILISGALLGLASFFTQTRGVVAASAFVVFLLWEGFQTQTWRNQFARLAQLLLSFVAAWVILSGYFIAQVGISKLFYFQIFYVLHNVISPAQNTCPAEHDPFAWPIRYMAVYFALPTVYAIVLWRSIRAPRDTRSSDATRAALLALTGAALFAEVAQNPNWFRVHSVAMPALILFVWLLDGAAGNLRGYLRFRAHAATIAWIGLVCLSGRQIAGRNTEHPLLLDLPAGRAAVVPRAGEKLTWMAARTKPGEFFMQSAYQSLYLPLRLRNPAFDSVDRYSSPELLELDIQRLKARPVRYILWSPLDLPRHPAFEQFLSERYHRVWRFSDSDEIWEFRTANPP
jgi:hypothetical protein